MPNQVNEVLEAIREVCDLKRLEFGCDFTDSKETYPHTIYEVRENHPFMFNALTDTHPDRFKDYDKTKCKIIGLPVHLEHLLWAIDMSGDTRYETIILKGSKLRIIAPTNQTETSIEEGVGINNEQYGTVVNDVWFDGEIDLQKSVEQNLNDNPDLTKWLHEVLVNKK